MARIKSDPAGAISGMVGPVVYYHIKGKQYVRAAIKPRERDSWSEGQVAYRQKVAKAAGLWRQLDKNPVRENWKLAAEGMSGYNLFLKTNLPAFKDDGSQVDLDWLHLSAGKLPLPQLLKAVSSEGDPAKWDVWWKDASVNGLSLKSDELLVIFAHDGKFSTPVATGVKRNQETAIIQVPEGMGTLQGMYLYFASADQKLFSMDQFVGV